MRRTIYTLAILSAIVALFVLPLVLCAQSVGL